MPASSAAIAIPKSRLPVLSERKAIYRVPSPLLYHRRSGAAVTDPMTSPVLDSPAQTFDKYNSKHTRLMSKIRAATQEKQNLRDEDTAEPAFVAARLPLMGEALHMESSDTDDGGVSLHNVKAECETISEALNDSQSTPAILTTTNTYLFPTNVYQVFNCPSSPWSGSSTVSRPPIRGSNCRLIFPKLTIPDQAVPHNVPRSSKQKLEQNIVLDYRSAVCPRTAGSKPAPIARLPYCFDSRNRSSTTDSLELKFDVATATKTADLLGNDLASSDTSVMPQREAVSCGRRSSSVGPEDDRGFHIRQMINSLFDDTAKLKEPSLEAELQMSMPEALFKGKPDSAAPDDQAGQTTAQVETPTAAADELVSEWSTEEDSEIELLARENVKDGHGWGWDDEDWESAPATPASEVDDRLGLYGTGWETK